MLSGLSLTTGGPRGVFLPKISGGRSFPGLSDVAAVGASALLCTPSFCTPTTIIYEYTSESAVDFKFIEYNRIK